MKLLILGGTVFLGRHMVYAAAEAGHEVTLFNRGQRNPDLFPDIEQLRGDRDGNLAALKGRQWDAVIDTSGYVPRIVRDSAALLADAVEHYTFISSISVYAGFDQPGMDEQAPLGTLEDEAVEEVTGETYGPLKVLCEQAAEQALPGRVMILRPGLIVGPHDPTDRFTYWPYRVAQGGELLAPNTPDVPVQVIDVRDLAEWTIRLIEVRQTGVFNAIGPQFPLTFGQMLETCRTTSESDAHFVWVDEAFLQEHGVQPWSELPVWVGSSPEIAGLMTTNADRAFAAGLTIRPLAETIRDTLAWHATRPPEHEWRAGLSPVRESELLRLWHSRAVT